MTDMDEKTVRSRLRVLEALHTGHATNEDLSEVLMLPYSVVRAALVWLRENDYVTEQAAAAVLPGRGRLPAVWRTVGKPLPSFADLLAARKVERRASLAAANVASSEKRAADRRAAIEVSAATARTQRVSTSRVPPIRSLPSLTSWTSPRGMWRLP